jgi:Tol biopolymer transport system component
MSQRKWAAILIALIVTIGYGIDVMAQGMFDAKPEESSDLPWKIAFVRDRNLWVMNANGTGQRELAGLGNITGRLGWAADGKRIVFSRQGQVNYELPDAGGGTRRIYDIFAKNIDSTRANAWWWVTNNHGSHTPEWSVDGEYILYTHDINANLVDAELPDYQIEYRNWDGSEVHRLTREGAAPRQSMGIQPTWSPDRERTAFIYVRDKVPLGLVIAPTSGIVRTDDELQAAAAKVPNVFGPDWSPDGKWIAFVNTQESDNGIYLYSPDDGTLKQIFNAAGGVVPHRAPISWSPDSKWLTFATVEGFIYVIGADGKNLKRASSGGNDYYPAFSTK